MAQKLRYICSVGQSGCNTQCIFRILIFTDELNGGSSGPGVSKKKKWKLKFMALPGEEQPAFYSELASIFSFSFFITFERGHLEAEYFLFRKSSWI